MSKKEYDNIRESIEDFPGDTEAQRAAWYGFIMAYARIGLLTTDEAVDLLDNYVKISDDEEGVLPV
jgi:hypothetical protein